MSRKLLLFKIVALLLSLSILLLTVAGCKKDTVSSPNNPANVSSEDISSGDTTSPDGSDISDISSENDLTTDESLDFDLDFDFEDFNFTVTQTVKFDNTAEQKEYAGLMGVLPCFWFVPDKTMEDPYTEEELEISVKKFLQMGLSTVR